MRSYPLRPIVLLIAPLIFILAAPQAGFPQTKRPLLHPPKREKEAVYSPDRFLVKFKSDLTSENPAMSGLPSIDALNAKHKTRQLKRLFKESHLKIETAGHLEKAAELAVAAAKRR